MRILIATGIVHPQIGGPALYAKHLANTWMSAGHEVSVRTFTVEKYLPTLIRHIVYALKVIPEVFRSDVVLALDTWSVGLPVAGVAKIFSKKLVIRTGGDFLWESYVERTKKKVLLVDFYRTEKSSFSKKEKLIFTLTNWLFRSADHVVFSTKWQKEIFTKAGAYTILPEKMSIIENFYGERNFPVEELHETKEFIGGTRKLVWKNIDVLEHAFSLAKKTNPRVSLNVLNYSPEEFCKRIQQSYAVILVSLGDISPNMILEAVRYGKPFILTRENGLKDRLGDCGVYVDPLNAEDIAEKILWLSLPDNYQYQMKKVRDFAFQHTWSDIAEEFVRIFKRL